MKILKYGTKKAQELIDNYNRARANDNHNLSCVYGSFSRAKQMAFEEIENEMEDANGFGLYVTSAGTSFFTCAYCVRNQNGLKLIYHTPTEKYETELCDYDII